MVLSKIEFCRFILKKNPQINKSKIVAYNEENLIGLDKLNVKRSIVPAITHVNLTARVQTIEKTQNEMYYNLISKFYELTSCPILINTS